MTERDFGVSPLSASTEGERLRLRHEYDPAPPGDSSRFIVRDRLDGEPGVAVILADSDEHYRTYHLAPWEIEQVVAALQRPEQRRPTSDHRLRMEPNDFDPRRRVGTDAWDESAMRSRGFEGFVEFARLPEVDVPPLPGVYCVVRPSADPPVFLESSPAGHFKGEDPTVSRADLATNWVDGAHVVYLGKAGAGASGRRGLRKRLDEFRLFGIGRPVGHRGGKRVWQLADSAELLAGWRVTADAESESVERELLSEFQGCYGRLPFANMRG